MWPRSSWIWRRSELLLESRRRRDRKREHALARVPPPQPRPTSSPAIIIRRSGTSPRPRWEVQCPYPVSGRLFETAVERFGIPRHLVTDQGSQFIAKEFLDGINELGVLHRFGAIGKTGSIALIERLWRTLKQTLMLKSFKPLVLDELKQRLALGLHRYAFLRPHQGLSGATPADVYVYFAQQPISHHAIPPPRARPGEHVGVSRIQIDYLDPEQRLPFLKSKAA